MVRVYRAPTRPAKRPLRPYAISTFPRLRLGASVGVAVLLAATTASFTTSAIHVACARRGGELTCTTSSRVGWRTHDGSVHGARIEVDAIEHEEDSDAGPYAVGALVLRAPQSRDETLALEDPTGVAAMAARLTRCLDSDADTCTDVVRGGWGVAMLSGLLYVSIALIIVLLFPVARLELDEDEGTIRLHVGRGAWTRLVYEGPPSRVRFRQRFEVMGDDADVHVLEAIVEGGRTHKLARGGEREMKRREKALNAFLERPLP